MDQASSVRDFKPFALLFCSKIKNQFDMNMSTLLKARAYLHFLNYIYVLFVKFGFSWNSLKNKNPPVKPIVCLKYLKFHAKAKLSAPSHLSF